MPVRTYRHEGRPVPLSTISTVTNIICDFGVCRGGTSSSTRGIGSIQPLAIARTWTVTPGFKSRQKTATLPENPFLFQKEVQDPGGVVTRQTNYYQWSGKDGNSVLSETVVSLPVAALCSSGSYNQLVSNDEIASKLISKLKSSDWQSPVFVAEARKTAQMVLSTSATLASVLRDLRRGRIDKVFLTLGIARDKRVSRQYYATVAKDPSSAAANAWLQLQYGWVPLLSDVKSAAETLASFVSDPRHTTLRASATSKRVVTRTYTVPYSGTPIGSGAVTLQATESDSRRFTVRYRVREPFRELGQLGILNPAAVAWELLPFSFVCDWFLPIGDYLSSLDVGIRYEFVSGFQGRKQTTTGFSQPLPDQTGAGLSWSKVLVQGSPLGSIPTPTLAGLTFRPELNLKRMFSGLALLRQNLKLVETSPRSNG